MTGADDRCGSEAGYRLHGRRDTAVCEGCRLAHNAYMRSYRRGGAAPYREQLARNRCRDRALARLADRHRAELHELTAEERAKEGLT